MNFSPFGSQNYDFYSKMVEFMLSYLKHIIFACGLKSHQLIRQKFGGRGVGWRPHEVFEPQQQTGGWESGG